MLLAAFLRPKNLRASVPLIVNHFLFVLKVNTHEIRVEVPESNIVRKMIDKIARLVEQV